MGDKKLLGIMWMSVGLIFFVVTYGYFFVGSKK
jgi:hypothetical protein